MPDDTLRADLAADSGSSLVGFIQSGTGAVSGRTVEDKLREFVLDARDFGVIADGSTDDTAALQLAIDEMIASHRELRLPEGEIKITGPLIIQPDDWLSYAGAFAAGPVIRGAGMGRSVIVSYINTESGDDQYVFDIQPGAHTGFKGLLGVVLTGFTLRRASGARAGGIRLQSDFHVLLEQLHIVSFSSTGVRAVCEEGDTDGNVNVTLKDCRIENCTGWGVDMGADIGHNENSYMELDHVGIQACGVDEALAVTAISKASEAVVTVTVGGGQSLPENGEAIYLVNVGGMTSLDSIKAGLQYVVKDRDVGANTFKLTGINSSALPTYTSGALVLRVHPKSGGLRWRGQVLRANAVGMTLNNNVSLFIEGGAGLAADVNITGSTIENPVRIGALVTGCTNMSVDVMQGYTNPAAGGAAYVGWLIDGTGFVCRNMFLQRMVVRAVSGDANFTAFRVMGANADRNTIRIRDVEWRQFDYAGQVRFLGVDFDPVPIQGELVVLNGAALRLRGNGKGNKLPMKRCGPKAAGGVTSTSGEWAAVTLPNGGYAKDTTGLSASTRYYAYFYDAEATAARPNYELSTTAPVLDTVSGYLVKTGDDNKLYVGSVATDASTLFVTTGGGWLNPLATPNAVGGFANLWADSSGKLRINTATPSSDTDGTVVGAQT